MALLSGWKAVAGGEGRGIEQPGLSCSSHELVVFFLLVLNVAMRLNERGPGVLHVKRRVLNCPAVRRSS